METDLTPAATEARARGAAPYGLLLTASLGVLLLARLIALRLNGTELFFDEAQYWTWSLEPAFGYYSKPPLIAWIVRLSTEACGTAEFCIRLASPILHTLTAAAIYLLGSRLYDARSGFWSALAYATLPGVSLSAGIISTDVPLLLFWSVALIGFAALLESRAWWPAIVLGAGLGLGLNAKYAMAYFALCAVVYLAVTPEHRRLARDPRLWLALLIGAGLIMPNLLWNAHNGFATFGHTADNAKWTGALLHPGKALEFFLAQFGVFGPILFAVLLLIVRRATRERLKGPDRLLLTFALPVIAVVMVQAFVSRAHANWAAPGYIAATVLVVATLLRDKSWRWLHASFVVNFAVMGLLMAGAASAGKFRLPYVGDPYARTLGWKEIARTARVRLEEARRQGRPFSAVITDERALTAELLYYMQGEPTPVLAWRQDGRPHDHYELTRPFTGAESGPVLLVALRQDFARVTGRFTLVTPILATEIPAGAGSARRVAFFLLEGYRGR